MCRITIRGASMAAGFRPMRASMLPRHHADWFSGSDLDSRPWVFPSDCSRITAGVITTGLPTGAVVLWSTTMPPTFRAAPPFSITVTSALIIGASSNTAARPLGHLTTQSPAQRGPRQGYGPNLGRLLRRGLNQGLPLRHGLNQGLP